jgi:hypothetical protein
MRDRSLDRTHGHALTAPSPARHMAHTPSPPRRHDRVVRRRVRVLVDHPQRLHTRRAPPQPTTGPALIPLGTSQGKTGPIAGVGRNRPARRHEQGSADDVSGLARVRSGGPGRTGSIIRTAKPAQSDGSKVGQAPVRITRKSRQWIDRGKLPALHIGRRVRNPARRLRRAHRGKRHRRSPIRITKHLGRRDPTAENAGRRMKSGTRRAGNNGSDTCSVCANHVPVVAVEMPAEEQEQGSSEPLTGRERQHRAFAPSGRGGAAS